MSDEIAALVKATIQAKVIQALNEAPEAVNKLVQAALEKPVDKFTGSYDRGSYGDKVPFLDYLVGSEIREATRSAVQKVVAESAPQIEAEVRKGLSAETVVAALTKSLIDTAGQDWRINVNFAAEKQR